jgi:hypothetical protein
LPRLANAARLAAELLRQPRQQGQETLVDIANLEFLSEEEVEKAGLEVCR